MQSFHVSLISYGFLCLSALVLLTYLLIRDRRLTWRYAGYAVLLGLIVFAEGFVSVRSGHLNIPFAFVTVESLIEFMFGLLILTMVLYEVRVEQESRLKQEKDESLETKGRLLNEIHHRVKNNLQVIVSLLGLQKRKIQDPELKRILENCQNRVTSMAMVHRKIYEMDVSSAMDLSDYLPDLTEHLLESQSSTDAKISTKFDLEPCRLPLDQMVTLGMVFSELITNAVDHAFRDQVQGTIEVRGGSEEDKLVRLSVRDDGVGWTPDGTLSEENSLGLQLVANLVQKQLGGTIEFERNNGTTVHLSIPLEPAEKS